MLTESQLAWCREKIKSFAAIHDQALAVEQEERANRQKYAAGKIVVRIEGEVS